MSWTIIKNKKQYLKALDRLEDIFDAKNNSKRSDEFDLLTMLVNRFE